MATNLKQWTKNKSITFKIFAITALFFIAFITVAVIFQSLFIGDFYLSRKTKNFEVNFKNFKRSYDNSTITSDNLDEYMNDFQQNNNAKIALVNPYTSVARLATQEMNSSGQSITFENGKSILAKAYSTWQNNSKLYSAVMVDNMQITYKLNDQLITVAPIIKENKVAAVFLATTSLQPVSEAAETLREFYVYFYILALFLIIILCFIFSNMITKPLKRLNKSALKMSHLNFTEKCDVKGDDEIGNLGSTLNFLSDNLSNALTSLQTANEKLKQDIEKEKQLEVMRKEFVAGVSHELKTPIALIGGYAEGLKDGIVEGEDKDYYLDVIMDESKKMSYLVSDMLDLSQLESGNFKLNKSYFLLDELISSLSKKHSNLILEKNIKFNVETFKEDIEVYGDPFRIEEVLTNFISNALKHTPNGGNIDIRVSQKEDKSILTEVTNTGENINSSELTNIWEKFYKLDKSRNRALGGTGLGLAIAKNILLLHHSHFGAFNTENGVTFYFTLKDRTD